jgi:predicted NBD/HSP70 family sugar kinase
MLTLGTGVGGGILADGRLLATADPNVGPVRTLRFAGRDLLVNGNVEPLQVPRP